jgi:hypothetical protein
MVLELLASIHEGLHNAQLASPLASPDIDKSNAFNNTDGDKVTLMTWSYKILGWIRDFFHKDGDIYGGATWIHCSRCIQSGYCTQYKDADLLSKSLQLTNTIDTRAFWESLLNKVLPSIHHDVDDWQVQQQALLIE